MRGDLHALLFCALVGLLRATRLEDSSEELAAASYRITLKGWCLNQVVEPDCDPETIIVVKKAFFNRAAKIKKLDCAVYEDGEDSCEPNITDAVIAACNSARTCAVPSSIFRHCKTGPFRQMKIQWECIAGSPATAQADMQLNTEEFEEEEVVQPVRKSQVPEQLRAMVVNNKEQQEEDIDDPGHKQEHHQAQGVITSPEQRQEESLDDEEVQEAIRKKKDYVKGVVDHITEDPQIEEVDYRACYRFTRWWKIYQLSPFARLTSCPGQESCYKVVMADGTYLTNDRQTPSPAEIFAGNIVQASDSLWVTWRSGIGLQRNDYNTWGVCLPNKRGKTVAVTLFNKLKEKHMGTG